MITQVAIGTICLFIGSLLTFVITILTTKNIQKSIAKEITLTHEQVHHQKSMETLIQNHIKDCPSAKDYKAMRAGVIFLVTKAEGDLHSLGLS
jgi:hypothetical protein